MDNVYNDFALFFREIITATGRLKKEEDLMKIVTQKLFIHPQEPILDAACGTGDALYYLHSLGFLNIEGLDASTNMIRRSKEKLPYTTFHNYMWEQLKDGVLQKKYKLIFIIGVSLLHAQVENIPEIIQAIYQQLLPGGVFLFDTRKWDSYDNYGVIQKNRPINRYKRVCNFEIGNDKYTVEDKCTYTSKRQNICYKVSSENRNVEDLYFEVSYARLSLKYLEKILYDVGFRQIEIQNENYWPYILIFAQK